MPAVIIRFIKTSLLMGVPFGFFMAIPVFGLAYLVVGWETSIMLGLATWIGAGVLFGCSMAACSEIFIVAMQPAAPKFEGHTIAFQKGANHFAGYEGRGGWLTMTETHLAFRSHGINFQNHPIDIQLEDIDRVVPLRLLLLFPTGLRVLLKDGTNHLFAVQNRGEWAKKIEEQIAQSKRLRL